MNLTVQNKNTPFLSQSVDNQDNNENHSEENNADRSDAIVLLSLTDQDDYEISYANREFSDLLTRASGTHSSSSRKLNNPVGKLLSSYLTKEDRKSLFGAIEQVIQQQRPMTIDWVLHVNDAQFLLKCQILVMNNRQGNPEKITMLLSDRASEIKQAKAFNELNYYDSLTGLPNKHHFYDVINDRLAENTQFGELAVLYVNLHRFQRINEGYGYETGDHLLQEVALRVQNLLPADSIIARYAGDKFIIALMNRDHFALEQEAKTLAGSIHFALNQKFAYHNHDIKVIADIGIAVGALSEDMTINHMIQNAHMAMERTNVSMVDRTMVYKPELKKQIQSRLHLEHELGNALKRDELFVQYQPIVCLMTGKLMGFEALIRWQHPERGLISPVEFIPLAEETGLILPIGKWVMMQACTQLQKWTLDFPELTSLFVTVNVSNQQIAHDDMVAVTRDALRHSGLAGDRLTLEITESSIMDNPDIARDILLDLKSLGIHLAIDDFGTGYSSLSYLNRFPADTIKIDKSFVSRMCDHEESYKIVHIIATLADTLGMKIVAEGIENPEQIDKLRKIGCQYGQGFLFSRPVSPPEARKILPTSYLSLVQNL